MEEQTDEHEGEVPEGDPEEGHEEAPGGENAPVPYHDANNGYRNRLFRNDIRSDEWSFQDVTESVGLSIPF